MDRSQPFPGYLFSIRFSGRDGATNPFLECRRYAPRKCTKDSDNVNEAFMRLTKAILKKQWYRVPRIVLWSPSRA